MPRLTSDQYAALTGEQKAEARKRHKHGVADAEDRTWDGKTYDSKAEMVYRRDIIEPQLLSGDIRCCIEQPRISLGVRENKYVADFFIVPKDGSPHFIDVKGMKTSKFIRDAKLWARFGPMPLKVIEVKSRAKGQYRFETTEVIQRGSTLP